MKNLRTLVSFDVFEEIINLPGLNGFVIRPYDERYAFIEIFAEWKGTTYTQRKKVNRSSKELVLEDIVREMIYDLKQCYNNNQRSMPPVAGERSDHAKM